MKKNSLRNKLMILFCITSILPILVLSFFSYYSSVHTIKENTQKMNDVSVKQIDDNLNIMLESYEDLLYQIYTDDNMVKWIDLLNAHQEEAVTINQMRRFIRSILNSKDYIRSITIITENGTSVTYDQLTAQTYQNAWMGQYHLDLEHLYSTTISDYRTHIFSTQYATTFANQDYYLFHMAHRIIDYRNLDKENGIVILSLDVELLNQICQISNEDNKERRFHFITDQEGKLVSYENVSQIGTQIMSANLVEEQRRKAYIDFVVQDLSYEESYIMLSEYKDESLGWNIIGITDQSSLVLEVKKQMWIVVAVSMGLFTIVIIVMFNISGQLLRAIESIVQTMKETSNGNRKSRVEVTQEMPIEMETIALSFNSMLEELEEALNKEKAAIAFQKDAQIKVLEAQINPHFLYNTLDTINWMAIDQDAFDISNAINSLAKILRYAISNSSQEVTVEEEMDWLKKYIYLQQFRLKEKLICNIQVEPDIQNCKIHKLLLQPFIENAFLHAFQDGKSQHLLEVTVFSKNNKLHIVIKDNGSGMSAVALQRFKETDWKTTWEDRHIGMKNAIVRLEMYYGNEAEVSISSQEGLGTQVLIGLPFKI